LRWWLIPQTGKLFIWDRHLVKEVKRNPWSIGDSLVDGLQAPATEPELSPNSEAVFPLDLLKQLPVVVPELPLFRGDKEYIILGGASDLGTFISLWMYKNGARNITLTSRRGLKFYEESAAVYTRQILSYLQSMPGVRLKVEAFDATSGEAMTALARGIDIPVGGCFIATLVLDDGLFVNQTPESFHAVSGLKLKVFEAFTSAFDIETLDFFVSLSSLLTVVGNGGQSSYGAGNALVDGMLTKYPNAFSILLPGITSLGYLDRVQEGSSHLHLESLSLSPDQMCAYIGDGLRKLAGGDRCSYYVLHVSWDDAERSIGLPPSCQHLIQRNIAINPEDSTAELDSTDRRAGVLGTVLRLLDVAESDFEPGRPLTSFGLDSLAATRVSQALKPFVEVSQMQLMGGITWEQLEERMDQS